MFYCICLLALMSYGGQTLEYPSCPNGFNHFPEERKCYKVFTITLPWKQAFQMCNQLGAHLVVVKNAEANAPLRTAITPFKDQCLDEVGIPAFWLPGGRYCANCSTFKWYTGSGNLLNIGYANWNYGEPNNYDGNEECMEIREEGTMGWNDVRCAAHRCFICEIDM